MRKTACLLVVGLAGSAFAAVPTVSNVALGGGRKAVVTYDLSGDPGIVTMAVETNTLADLTGAWLPINGTALRNVQGDVSKLVQPGIGHRITWRPFETLGASLKRARVVLTAWPTNAPPDYLVVNLAGKDVPRYYTSTNYFPYGFGHLTYKTTNIVFKLVRAKGCSFCAGEYDYIDSYAGKNPHVINMTRDYYLAIYELTQAQYHWATGNKSPWNTTHWPSDKMYYDSDQPASIGWRGNWRNGTTWKDPLTKSGFCGCASAKSGLHIDLPTEAEWEFAARCGGYRTVSNQIVDGEDATNLFEVANVKAKWGDVTAQMIAVGSLKPNDWGFYDMIGNVTEMCLDWVNQTSNNPDAITEETTDPHGLTEGGNGYVFRGSTYATSYGYNSTGRSCYGQGQVGWGCRAAVVIEEPSEGEPAVATASVGVSASPTVADVKLGQNHANRNIVVTYNLSKHAIVTWTLETNAVANANEGWVTVDESKANTRIWGDVNRLVEKTGACSFQWNPDETWADQAVAEGRARAVLTAWPTNHPPLYMVVDLLGGPLIRYYTSTNALPDGGLSNNLYRTRKHVLRKIPAKDVIWSMGIPEDVGDGSYAAFSAENRANNTSHWVKITYDYYIGIFELSAANWGNAMNSTKGYGWMKTHKSFQNARPAGGEYPSHFRTNSTSCFCGRLRNFHGSAHAFDVVSSAEWEFAYRAGEPRTLYTGKDWTAANIYACGAVNSNNHPMHDVGTVYPPNKWGLYDLLGNVWDGVRDTSKDVVDWKEREDYKTTGICVDPVSSAGTVNYVGRGFNRVQWYQIQRGDNFIGTQGTVSDNQGYRIVCPIPKNAD